MEQTKSYEYEERAFLTEESFFEVKEKLENLKIDSTPDNKTSYFFVLPDKNISIASSNSKTVVKYKAGQLGKGNGFNEHEFSILPDALPEAIHLFSALFNLEPLFSEQFRINYVLPNLIEVALKYTQTWGFHLEIEKVYEDVEHKEQAKNYIYEISKVLGIEFISDEQMAKFMINCKSGKHKGEYTPDEFIQKFKDFKG